jgi:hypothetical protein
VNGGGRAPKRGRNIHRRFNVLLAPFLFFLAKQRFIIDLKQLTNFACPFPEEMIDDDVPITMGNYVCLFAPILLNRPHNFLLQFGKEIGHFGYKKCSFLIILLGINFDV